VTIYWPDDHPECALKTDERFYRTARDVDEVLGSNIEIPELLTDKVHALPVKRSQGVSSLMQAAPEDSYNEAIQDAFAPLRELVFGPTALIDQDLYRKYSTVSERVLSCVSVITSRNRFVFYALRGTDNQAPRWVLLQDGKPPCTELVAIAACIRSELPSSEPVDLTTEVWSTALETALAQLPMAELELLPNRQRRALDVLKYCVENQAPGSDAEATHVELIRSCLNGGPGRNGMRIDLRRLARAAIKAMSPKLQELRSNSRRSTFVSIKRLIKEHRKGRYRLSENDLAALADEVAVDRPLEERIIAAIVGVKQESV
jgi:hypothetical protein